MNHFDADSVAALIVDENGRYVMQERDRDSKVSFSGLFGLFGGAIDPGEFPEAALIRELQEELTFCTVGLAERATLIFDERSAGGLYCRRRYYEVNVTNSMVSSFVLNEGAAMHVLDPETIVACAKRVIPYDLCAILMHQRMMSVSQ